ncbi:MAG: serine protease [Hormoscilla sp.]
MKRSLRVKAVLLVVTVILTVPLAAAGQSITDIKKKAQESTVLILRETVIGPQEMIPEGSGVIIGWEETGGDKYTYYVLTADHVIPKDNTYEVKTHDGERYSVNLNTAERMSGGKCVDLAVLQFTSDRPYSPIELESPSKLIELKSESKPNQGTRAHLFGWADGTREQFTTGKIIDWEYITILDIDSSCTSLALEFPENQIQPGMSGGPILYQNGKLVGIFVANRLFGPFRGTSIEAFRDRASYSVLSKLKVTAPEVLQKPIAEDPRPQDDPKNDKKLPEWVDVLLRILIVPVIVGIAILVAIAVRTFWEEWH